jgi:hypothetical protein
MWTVIFYFENDVHHHYNLSKTAAKKLIDIACFSNEDCIHFRCFKQGTEVPKLPEPLQRGQVKTKLFDGAEQFLFSVEVARE